MKVTAREAEESDGIASRLSYLLWDSMPDQELMRVAAAGGLRTPDGVEKAARRMLDDPRARQALGEFFQQWLRLERVLERQSSDGAGLSAIHTRAGCHDG